MNYEIKSIQKEITNIVWGTYTMYDGEITKNSYGYELNFKTPDLKVGGEDDIDSNCSDKWYEISSKVEKHIKKNYKNIIIKDMTSEYKGSWNITLSDKTESKSDKKIKTLEDKVSKFQKELSDFKVKIADKIKNQTSKLKTCTYCYSKVSVKFFKDHSCPVCNTELFSNTEQKRIDSINSKIQTVRKELSKIK